MPDDARTNGVNDVDVGDLGRVAQNDAGALVAGGIRVRDPRAGADAGQPLSALEGNPAVQRRRGARCGEDQDPVPWSRGGLDVRQ